LDSTSCQSTEGWATLVDCGGVYYSTGYVSTEFTWRCNAVTESKNSGVQNGMWSRKDMQGTPRWTCLRTHRIFI